MPSYHPKSTLRQWLIKTDETIRQELRAEVDRTSAELKAFLEDNTSDWSHKPKFRRIMSVKPDLIRASVQAVGEGADIFGYVNLGTGKYGKKGSAYLIRPKIAGGYLRFKTGYSARTAPGTGGGLPQGRVGTGKASGQWVTTRQVLHPGIRPRKFVESFDKQLSPTFAKRIMNALKRAVRRT